MHLTAAWLGAWLLAAVACTKSTNDTHGKPTAPVTTSACQSADDCVIECFASAGDCCGDACGCAHAFPKTDAAKLEREHRAACPSRPRNCPEHRCSMARNWPACRLGVCAAVPAPERPTCTSDADCTLATAREGACCPGCEQHAWAVRDLDAYRTWSSEQCAAAACATATCPAATPAVARCDAGRCVVAVAATPSGSDSAAVTAFFAAKSWKTVRVEKLERLPHVYRAVFADGSQLVRVRDGRVVETKGLDPMTDYLKQVKGTSLVLDDAIVLLDLFDAYASRYLGPSYYTGKEYPSLRPAFEGGVLKLYYLQPHAAPEAVPNPNVIKVTRATLDFRSEAPAWKSETFDFDTKR